MEKVEGPKERAGREKKKAGQKAEELAARHLASKGYVLLERNYRTKWGEIDLICRKDSVLVFVEVRSKSTDRFGEPEESITLAKINKIRKTAFAYLQKEGLGFCRHFRFDVITVVNKEGKILINHLESAF